MLIAINNKNYKNLYFRFNSR